jgi:hypothetical protein
MVRKSAHNFSREAQREEFTLVTHRCRWESSSKIIFISKEIVHEGRHAP